MRFPIRASLLLLITAASVFGKVETILYIHGDFEDKPMGVSEKKWQANSKMLHTTLNNYWIEHSYGSITEIKATYTPALRLPGTTKDYYDYNKLASGMKTAAKKAGYPPQDYKHVAFFYPSIPHNISFGGLGGGGQIWLPGRNPFDGGLIHEFGHSLGLGHANSIEGKDKTVYPGERREGRDGLHMMGSDGHNRIGPYSTINLPMRFRLGFFDKKHVKVVKNAGTYRLFEYELKQLPEKGHIGLRLKIRDDDFWVSYGYKMTKRWGNFKSDVFKKGVIVHRLQGSVTDLLDFTPGSAGKTKNEEDYVDTRDGGLAIGTSYTFPKSRTSITPISVGKDSNGLNYIDVEISFSKSAKNSPLHDRLIHKASGTTEQKGDLLITKAKTASLTKTTESFVYYSNPLKGDNDSITAYLKSFADAAENSRAGVMIRSGEGSSAPHASLFLDGDANLSFVWRESNGRPNKGEQVEMDLSKLKKLGLRLSRDKTTVTGFYTLDGKHWTKIKTINLPYSSIQLKGIAVSSGDPEKEVIAVFEKVTL